MKKVKSKKFKVNSTKGKHSETISIVIICISIFIFFTVHTDSVGLIGQMVRRFVLGLFGAFSFIAPLFLFAIGLNTIFSLHKKFKYNKFLCITGMLVLVMLIFHVWHLEYLDITDLSSFMFSSYGLGIEGKGSGSIISPVVFAVNYLLGNIGSLILYKMLFLILFLKLTKISCTKIFIKMFNLLKIVYSKSNKSIQATSSKLNNIIPKQFKGEVIKVDSMKSSTTEDLVNLKEAFNKKKPQEFGTTKEIIGDIEQKIPNNVDEDSSREVIDKIKIKNPSDSYQIPSINLLKSPIIKANAKFQDKDMLENAKLLEDTLSNFGISAKVVQVSRGPTITRYELQPAPGIKVSRIVSLSDDIALSLAAPSVRIEAPIPGKAAIGIEIPNQDITAVLLKEVIESEEFISANSSLIVGLGKDISGKNIVADISKMPHLLIAGATGSGKSVCVNTLIVSILYKSSPDEVKMLMIDPKVVELNNYNGIPHLLVPVVTDPRKAAGALNWVVQEMTNRYKLFAEKGVRDIERYNSVQEEKAQRLPKILVIIDELADLMMVAPSEVEDSICRLAQMARAAGIHLIIATQRPSVDVITGVIKANIPSRISFAVSSYIDSRTILDMGGAEKLLGRGDMLFYPLGINKPIRVQGAFVSEKEIEAIIGAIKLQNEQPQYSEVVFEEVATAYESSLLKDADELLPQAIDIALDLEQISISMIQRRLRVGYSRAARLIDEMEARNLISSADGSKPRNVLVTRESYENGKAGI